MLITGRANDVCREVIGAAIEVHRHLGPGLLESTYVVCLLDELRARGLSVVTQLPILYKSRTLDASYRLDLMVEELVVVEVKAVDHLLPVHEAQLLTYLRLTGCPAGLLINFNVPKLVTGIKRRLNTIPE
jgi:GxxExxY protein